MTFKERILSKSTSPLVFAHRGVSSEAPENTIKAFQRAIDQNADGIELDVFLTKDRQIVVTHDRNTKRLTGVEKDVCHSTYQELCQLDFGEHQKIPLLSEVFETLKTSNLFINIEIKSMGLKSNGIEKLIVDLIETYNFDKRVLISSFNPLHLKRIKSLNPDLPLGYLVCEEQSKWIRSIFLIHWIQPLALNLDYNFAAKPAGQKLMNLGLPVLLWTINKETDMRFWLQKNIKGIITNYPKILQSLI